LKRIFRLLQRQNGTDFSRYKHSTVYRRLALRMALRQASELPEYPELLTKDAAEVQALAQDFLIRVTSFFRDPETFEGLAETVFPALSKIALTRSATNLGPRLRIGRRGLFHRDCPAGVRNCKGYP
jgi:two-component system, chemotaxis family, CheB/CheR fusion protein